MKFTLNFKSDNYGKKVIDEPIGMSQIIFSLKQKEMGMARDISLTSGEAQFEFVQLRNHELKQILYYNRKFGFESIIELTAEIDENNKLIFELDFADSETDDLEYFRCKGIQQGKFQILKRRKELIVDVKNDLDLDGNYIGGLVPVNMLLLAKPVVQMSEWGQVTPFVKSFSGFGQDALWASPAETIKKSGIESTLNPFSPFFELPPLFSASKQIEAFDALTIINAENNLTDVVLSIKGLSLSITGTGLATKNTLVIAYSKTWAAGTVTLIRLEDVTGTLDVQNKDYFITIPKLERGTKVAFYASVFQPYGFPAGTPVSSSVIDMTLSGGISISTESVAYNSVSPSFRLIDVMRQVVKSISGLDINAPRFDVGGEFYDNRLLDGNFLRGISNKNFSISLEDIENSLSEIKGDWEIGSDGKIFFGIEQDFYTNTESWFFNNTQFSSMNKTYNHKYKINDFRYSYKNYQSLKENEEPNSADTIHGESRLSLFNKLVENKKEVSIEWTRDAFLIEETRRKALIIEENTASQNDDTLFCIDSIATSSDRTFIEVASFNHSFNVGTGRLSLTNDGTLNFISIGIQVGSVFAINPSDPNTGTYTVFSVLGSVLELNGIGATAAGNGIRQTNFTYTLSASFVPFTNYTDLGFSETSGLSSAESYSNRRYSITRNIYNYYKSYLATCNLYWKDKVVKNTWYKNNGEYTAKYNGIKLTEKADFIPDNPILTPILYNEMIFSNVQFEDFIFLQNNIRSQRGFFRTIDNNDQVVKVYPVDADYKLLEKELTIKAEERFEPTSMIIVTGNLYILINNYTRLLSLHWQIKNEKLYVFDENRYRLFNGVYWMEVSINGAIASNLEELKNWMRLINNSVEIN